MAIGWVEACCKGCSSRTLWGPGISKGPCSGEADTVTDLVESLVVEGGRSSRRSDEEGQEGVS